MKPNFLPHGCAMAGSELSAAAGLRCGSELVVVDICSYKVLDEPGKVLASFALGSCVAVCLYDPEVKVAGMIHYMLPESKIDPGKAESNPAMFGDTGLPCLFQDFYAKGGKKRRLKCYLVGGASTIDCDGSFNVGRKNVLLARKLFWKSGINVEKEDTGGRISRSVFLSVDDGRVVVKSPGGGEQVL